MRPGPSAAVKLLPSVLNVASPPRDVHDWLVEISLDAGWATSAADAAELAERWKDKFLLMLRRELSAMNESGRHCVFDFNSSSEYMIQGSAFVEPGVDSQELADAKRRRHRFQEYVDALKRIDPEQFEAVCRGVLSLLWVASPKLTPATADEGIDFYGQMRLDRILNPTGLPGVRSKLDVWMVGQAKHYPTGQAATPEIRELVGSVELARNEEWSRMSSPYPDMRIRSCDPVFFLFFTTGTISSYGWRLIEASGVVGMDGEMLAAFLADNSVGVTDGEFDASALDEWIISVD